MYKITIGGILTIDRVVNNLVLTCIQAPNFTCTAKYEIIFKGCDEDIVVLQAGFDEANTINITQNIAFFGGLYSSGIYIFKLYDINNNAGYATEITILNFSKTLNQIIRDIRLVLCRKCGCEECKCQESSKCVKLNSLYNKIQTYTHSNRPFYIGNIKIYSSELHKFLQDAYMFFNCKFNTISCCSGINTSINGEISFNELETKTHLGIMYCGIYFYHKYSIAGLTEQDIKDVDAYFGFPDNKRCLEALVNFSELENIYLGNNPDSTYMNNVVVFTISPLTGEQGILRSISASTTIVSNDDIITSALLKANGSVIIDLLSTVDDGVQMTTIPDLTQDTTFDLVITYIRNGIVMTETITNQYDAITPQWYGITNIADFDGLTYGEISGELNKVIQVSPEIQRSLAPTSKYVYFISTKSDALISNSGFNVSIGNWDSTTSAFIKKQINITLNDSSVVTMTMYRSRELKTHSSQSYKIY